jgi:hypothetical protein
MPSRDDKQPSDARRRAYAKAQEKVRRAAERSAARGSAREQTTVVVQGERKRELRLIAHLFLVSSVTMLLFMMYVIAALLKVTVPYAAGVVWIAAMAAGGLATYVYGIFVTARFRRWWWLVVIAIPLSCVPGALAYAWTRRMEIEHETFGP